MDIPLLDAGLRAGWYVVERGKWNPETNVPHPSIEQVAGGAFGTVGATEFATGAVARIRHVFGAPDDAGIEWNTALFGAVGHVVERHELIAVGHGAGGQA